MPQAAVYTAAVSLGGWYLAIPLSLTSLFVAGAALWFLRCSRGRRLVPDECVETDPLPR